MKLYSISDEYISFLRKSYPRIYSNKEDSRIHTRKYLGAVIEISGYNYYIPLSSPKAEHDYVEIDGKRKIRKSSLIVIRITKTIFSDCCYWTTRCTTNTIHQF